MRPLININFRGMISFVRSLWLSLLSAVLLSSSLSSFANNNQINDPAKPGPYKIGYRQITVTDTTRTSAVDPVGRVLTLWVWYPIDNAVAAGGITPVYDPDSTSLLNYGIPPTYIQSRPSLDVRVDPSSVLALSLSGSNIPACDNPFNTACSKSTIVGLPVSAQGTFPVLGLSHGSTAPPIVYTRLTEHLASHGYIVVAPGHEGDTFADSITYAVTGGLTCEALPFRPCTDSGDVPALNRPQDVSFALDKVFDGTFGADLKNAANIQKVGVLGQSFGGYTTLMLAGGLQTATGSFPAGALADPRIKAAAELSGFDEDVAESPTYPALLLPKPNIEAIHVPMMVMYGELETNVLGYSFVEEGQDFFNRLNPANTGVQYRVAMNKAVHNSFLNFCEQGWLDTIKLGNANPADIDFAVLISLFNSDLRIPTFPPNLTGKTDEGFQAVCRNDFLYEPSNRAIWDALTLPPPAPAGITLGSLLLNNPPYSIPLNQLPGFIDPATLEFVPTKNSDEIQNITNSYLVSFFNVHLKGQPQFDRFIEGGTNAIVEQCRQADSQRKCKLR